MNVVRRWVARRLARFSALCAAPVSLQLIEIKELIRMNNEEQLARLAAIEEAQAVTLAQVQKVGGETQGLIDEVAALKAAIDAGAQASPEVQAAIERISTGAAAIKAALQLVDQKVDDPIIAPPPVEPAV